MSADVAAPAGHGPVLHNFSVREAPVSLESSLERSAPKSPRDSTQTINYPEDKAHKSKSKIRKFFGKLGKSYKSKEAEECPSDEKEERRRAKDSLIKATTEQARKSSADENNGVSVRNAEQTPLIQKPKRTFKQFNSLPRDRFSVDGVPKKLAEELDTRVEKGRIRGSSLDSGDTRDFLESALRRTVIPTLKLTPPHRPATLIAVDSVKRVRFLNAQKINAEAAHTNGVAKSGDTSPRPTDCVVEPAPLTFPEAVEATTVEEQQASQSSRLSTTPTMLRFNSRKMSRSQPELSSDEQVPTPAESPTLDTTHKLTNRLLKHSIVIDASEANNDEVISELPKFDINEVAISLPDISVDKDRAVYCISVNFGHYSRFGYLSYTSLRALHKEMKSWKIPKMPKFPKRTVFRRVDRGFLEKRKEKLQEYYMKLLLVANELKPRAIDELVRRITQGKEFTHHSDEEKEELATVSKIDIKRSRSENDFKDNTINNAASHPLWLSDPSSFKRTVSQESSTTAALNLSPRKHADSSPASMLTPSGTALTCGSTPSPKIIKRNPDSATTASETELSPGYKSLDVTNSHGLQQRLDALHDIMRGKPLLYRYLALLLAVPIFFIVSIISQINVYTGQYIAKAIEYTIQPLVSYALLPILNVTWAGFVWLFKTVLWPLLNFIGRWLFRGFSALGGYIGARYSKK